MSHSHPPVSPRRPWPLAAAALLALTACGPRGEVSPRPTPPPRFASIASVGRADILGYAHSLQFDTTQPAQDAQYIVVPRAGQLAVGPYASVAPEIGAAVTHDALTRGRIFARLTLAAPLPEAGLPAGVTYVWVDSTSTGLRAMLVPEADTAPVVPATVRTIAACVAGRPTCLRAAAQFSQPDPLPVVTALTICHPCDCRICCDSAALVQPVSLNEVRLAKPARPAPAR